jgi:surfactin synthase thioesterase subunit
VAKEIIIAFAGTDTLEDIGTDVNYFLTPFTTAPGCDNCQVHNGVLLGWRSLQPSLMAALKNLVADSPGYTTVIVGHSLGGGLASIAFTDLRSNGVPIAKTYTMGSLRVGNPAYADYTDRLSGASNTNLGDLLRMTHGIDGVPNLPTQAMGFRHTRTEIYEVDNASGAESPQTTYRCFGQEAPDCNLSTTTGIINQDHLTYTGIFMASGAQCYSSD